MVPTGEQVSQSEDGKFHSQQQPSHPKPSAWICKTLMGLINTMQPLEIFTNTLQPKSQKSTGLEENDGHRLVVVSSGLLMSNFSFSKELCS